MTNPEVSQLAISSKSRLREMHDSVERYINPRIPPPIAARLLLALHEIIANIIRHSRPTASHVEIYFARDDGRTYCIVRDDGAAFEAFDAVWQHCQSQEKNTPFFLSPCIGLRLVRHLWPEAFYKTDDNGYNYFILPLTRNPMYKLPALFHLADDGTEESWQLALDTLLDNQKETYVASA